MRITFFTLILTMFASQFLAQDRLEIFWSDQGAATMNVTYGTGQKTQICAKDQEGIRNLNFDPVNRQLYWTNFGSGIIWRSEPDGSKKKQVIKSDEDITAFTIDEAKALIYFVEGHEDRIQVANLDGSDPREFVLGAGEVQGMDVDHRSGMLYWTDIQGGRVMRVPADGMEMEVIFETEEMVLNAISLDTANDRVYITERFFNTINRMDLNGANFEEIRSLQGLPGSICVDGYNDRIYYKEGDKIQQADLEGDDPYTLLAGVEKISGLAIFTEGESSMAKFEE